MDEKALRTLAESGRRAVERWTGEGLREELEREHATGRFVPEADEAIRLVERLARRGFDLTVQDRRAAHFLRPREWDTWMLENGPAFAHLSRKTRKRHIVSGRHPFERWTEGVDWKRLDGGEIRVSEISLTALTANLVKADTATRRGLRLMRKAHEIGLR